MNLAVLLAAVVSQLDPAAWGGNHAGKPIPEFTHGDECLFCHRNDIGQTWQKNTHGRTVRQVEDAPDLAPVLGREPSASGAEYFLGSRNHVRFLKKDGYGKFALLATRAEKPEWQRGRFGESCAGCHATAVDSAAKTFQYFGLDCYTCHGSVDQGHTKDTALVLLSKKRRSDAKLITSICAQCHLRGGKSRSTGLAYPNNFVAGDNLFQDYEVDWAKADDTSLNAGDRHVHRNARDVAKGGSATTCLSCHRVHDSSSTKHRFVLREPICLDCHNAEGPRKEVKQYTVRSDLCEY